MRKIIIFLFSCLILLLLHSKGVCAPLSTDPVFQQAQQLYYHENYEEALEALKNLKSKYPQSSEIAFYLGMTYKRMQDYRAAQPLLEEACRLQPRFDQAVPELIEILHQNDRPDEALKWINEAEREFIAPGQVAFLKGLVLLKQGRVDPAVKAFDDAEALEPSLAQSATYQKAVALSQQKDYSRAREQLRSVVIKDPTSDLAAFANEYLDALRRQQEMARALKGSVSYSLQYDDNVIFKPTDSSLASDVSGVKDWVHVFTAQTEWTIKQAQAKEFGLNAVYSFYGTKHNDIGLYDSQSHDFSLQPAYYAGKTTFAFPMHYNSVYLNEESYLDTAGVSTLFNIADAYNRLWQLQLQYNLNNYQWPVSSAPENRDTRDVTLSAGRYWFWDSSGYLNLYYAANYSDATGDNWVYLGNRLVLTLVMPLTKTWKWNFVTDLFRQDFENVHTTYDKERKDTVITVSNLLVKALSENLELQAQHTYSYDLSNIAVYKYRKNTYTMGMKYRF